MDGALAYGFHINHKRDAIPERKIHLVPWWWFMHQRCCFMHSVDARMGERARFGEGGMLEWVFYA